MNRLRGVAVGAGYFSRLQYEAWQRTPEAGIVAVVNRDPTKARETAARHGAGRRAAVAPMRHRRGIPARRPARLLVGDTKQHYSDEGTAARLEAGYHGFASHRVPDFR